MRRIVKINPNSFACRYAWRFHATSRSARHTEGAAYVGFFIRIKKETVWGRLRPLESHLLEFSTMGASLVIHCITPTDIRTCKPYVVANSAVAKKAIMPATTRACWSPVNWGNMGNETISEAVLSATGKSPARYPSDA